MLHELVKIVKKKVSCFLEADLFRTAVRIGFIPRAMRGLLAEGVCAILLSAEKEGSEAQVACRRWIDMLFFDVLTGVA